MNAYNIFSLFSCVYQKSFVSLSIENKKNMKREIIYRNRTILETTNGTFQAFYSNYSANLTKHFKTLDKAKKQIDKWLDN